MEFFDYVLLFLALCVGALVLLGFVVLFMIWQMRRWIENLVSTDPEVLQRVLDKLRKKHPDLSEEALISKVISRQANRAGLVGFITGLGGLPVLPITLPIDIAASVKIQSSMVHMIRMVRGVHSGDLGDRVVTDAGLLVITTGGQELTSASSAAIRQLIVKSFSKSLLKFLPLIGGIVGFGLNWASTQTMGRMADRLYRLTEEQDDRPEEQEPS